MRSLREHRHRVVTTRGSCRSLPLTSRGIPRRTSGSPGGPALRKATAAASQTPEATWSPYISILRSLLPEERGGDARVDGDVESGGVGEVACEEGVYGGGDVVGQDFAFE